MTFRWSYCPAPRVFSLFAGDSSSALVLFLASGLLLTACKVSFVLGEDPAATCPSIDLCHCATNLGFALVRWPHPRGQPPTRTTLGGAGETRWCFRECLLARPLSPVWENSSLRITMSSILAPCDSTSCAAGWYITGTKRPALTQGIANVRYIAPPHRLHDPAAMRPACAPHLPRPRLPASPNHSSHHLMARLEELRTRVYSLNGTDHAAASRL